MEGTPKEEDVDQSRRGFLKGLGALGATVAIGGVAYLSTHKEETSEDFSPKQEVPYAVPIEQLSREEVMEEIVHNVSRVQSLERLRDHDEMPDAIFGELLQYFFERFSPNAPSREDTEAEIAILNQRISDLRDYRDHVAL